MVIAEALLVLTWERIGTLEGWGGAGNIASRIHWVHRPVSLMGVEVVQGLVSAIFCHVEDVTFALAVAAIICTFMGDILRLSFTPALFFLPWPWIFSSKWINRAISKRILIFIIDLFWDSPPFSHFIEGWKLFPGQLIIDCSHIELSSASTLSNLGGSLRVILTTVPWLVPSLHSHVCFRSKAIVNILLPCLLYCFVSTLAVKILEVWISQEVNLSLVIGQILSAVLLSTLLPSDALPVWPCIRRTGIWVHFWVTFGIGVTHFLRWGRAQIVLLWGLRNIFRLLSSLNSLF